MNRRRTGERLVNVALVVVVLAGGLVVNHVQRYGSSLRSFVGQGQLGERLELWPGSVVVHAVRAARELDTSGLDVLGGGSTVPPTGGVWVAVDLSVAGGDQPGPSARVQLVDASGRTFDPSDRAEASFAGRPQPGAQHRYEVVFEVPEDALGEMTVVVAERFPYQLGAEVRVPVDVVDVADDALVPAEPVLEDPVG